MGMGMQQKFLHSRKLAIGKNVGKIKK